MQVLRSDLRGDQSPVLAAVGPMQFEVVEDRMTNEFNSPIRFSRLDYQVARRTDAAGAAALAGMRGVEVLAAQRRHPAGALRRPVARHGHRPGQPRRHARGAPRRRRLTAVLRQEARPLFSWSRSMCSEASALVRSADSSSPASRASVSR